jgi:DNA-binding beta-propeller fold protein YncE
VESGECVATVASEGEGDEQLLNPHGVAFNSQGELFVSDPDLHRIQVFDREGALVRGFGEKGFGDGKFNKPYGLAFTPRGDLVVTEFGNHRVQVLREDGMCIRAFGSKGVGLGEFTYPRDVAVGEDGSIYVLEGAPNGHCRLQVFDEEGGFLRAFGLRGDGLQWPSHIAVGCDGIFVSTDGKGVDVFDMDGGYVQTILAGVYAQTSELAHLAACHATGEWPVHAQTSGLAVDAAGCLFVGCSFTSDDNVKMFV